MEEASRGVLMGFNNTDLLMKGYKHSQGASEKQRCRNTFSGTNPQNTSKSVHKLEPWKSGGMSANTLRG